MMEHLVTSSLLNNTFPLEDFKFPAIKLNKVVLPDPLGPMIPVIDPSLIFKEQSDTAAKPPKYLDRFSICKNICLDHEFYLFNLLCILLEFFLKIYKNQLLLISLTPCSFNPLGV